MSEKRQTCKVFVGGLSWETTDQRLRNYFENYGAVSEAFVSFDRVTGRPRGFGFVVFEDPGVADKVVSIQHTIDRREVEAKKAVPKEENPAGRTASGALNQRTKKIFVGGLAQSVDDQAFRKFFEQYGQVEDAVVMYDHDNKRPRGFGFVTFATEEGVDEVFTGGALQTLHDKPIEIKRAVPRDQIATARGRTAFGNNQTPRLESAASGPFGAAAMGPAFTDEAGFPSNLLHSHSMGAPGSQPNIARLASAASMGHNMALFSPDLSNNLGLTNQIYQALSGQLSGNLGNQLSGPLAAHASVPTQTSGLGALANNNLYTMARAGSAHLPTVGSTHLPVTLAQQNAALQQLGSAQLPPLSNVQQMNMGSTQLASANSGLLDEFNPQGLQSYPHDSSAFSNAATNGYTNNHSSPIQNHFGHDSSAFANTGANGFSKNPSSGYASGSSVFADAGSAFAKSGGSTPFGTSLSHQQSGLERAFSSMALEHRPSFQEASLPAASAFEERVQMLSAGSAGLGQLPSPKLPSPYSRQQSNLEGTPGEHHSSQ